MSLQYSLRKHQPESHHELFKLIILHSHLCFINVAQRPRTPARHRLTRECERRCPSLSSEPQGCQLSTGSMKLLVGWISLTSLNVFQRTLLMGDLVARLRRKVESSSWIHRPRANKDKQACETSIWTLAPPIRCPFIASIAVLKGWQPGLFRRARHSFQCLPSCRTIPSFLFCSRRFWHFSHSLYCWLTVRHEFSVFTKNLTDINIENSKITNFICMRLVQWANWYRVSSLTSLTPTLNAVSFPSHRHWMP